MISSAQHKKLCILGSTGSIGESTLELVRQHPGLFSIHSLSAHTNIELLLEQCLEFKPAVVVIVDADVAEKFVQQVKKTASLKDLQVLVGKSALQDIARSPDNDTVMASIVGAAGLDATLAAAESGKRILLANKEALVMSGSLFMDQVRKNAVELLPIDSEHNAVFQCMAEKQQHLVSQEMDKNDRKSIKRVILTASGGPFLNHEIESLGGVTPDEACKHPKWEMGRKISVDSATLMNKGLEVIEACLLFNLPPEQVEVIIHPQSIVHSMVEYIDGSVLAQMANPDMKIPIAYGLAWPERIETGVPYLDLLSAGNLQFEKPDLDRFPCLALAYRAIKMGSFAITALNAANEVAVDSFLKGKLPFLKIAEVIEYVLDKTEALEITSIKQVLDIDEKARHIAKNFLEKTDR